jgi:hypothetical protein
MPKKKVSSTNSPATQGQIESLASTVRDALDYIIREIKDFRLEHDHNWKAQWQFNQEISQKVDMNTDAIKALDTRVRYQDDMPERLDHLEHQQYELTRRVIAIENKK